MPDKTDRVDILLVDDQPAKLLSYETILRELDENLIRANSASEALQVLLKREVALVLTDVCMPDLDGFELARLLRDHPRHEKTAIIFISAVQVSDEDRIRGYASGAVDYVPVPIIPEILRAKVKIFVELYRKSRELHSLNIDLERRVSDRTAALEASAAQLRESEERMRLASDAAGFGTYDYSAGSELIYWSQSLRRLVGVTDDEPLTLERAMEAIHLGDRDLVRSHMRGSSEDDERRELEFRIVRPDGETRWCLARGQRMPSSDYSTDGARIMGTVIDITERKDTEERQRLLMAELDHRVKNVLSNVSAIARLSSRNATAVPEFVTALDGRIQAMSRAHNLLRRATWQATNFGDLVSEVLTPFQSTGGRNIEWEGSELWVKPQVVQPLALVLHELATNAVKYGALSTTNGRVKVSWSAMSDAPGCMRFAWREEGGPKTSPPTRKGFGFNFLETATTDIGAIVDWEFNDGGLSYFLSGPFEVAAPLPIGAERIAPIANPVGERAAESRRVLIVEDECLVAMELQQQLEDDGHSVVGPALSLAHGLTLVEEEFDAALIDVSLGRDTSALIAERLLARAIPFAFATGYSDSSILPEHLRAVPRLNKPYVGDQVRGMIARLIKN